MRLLVIVLLYLLLGACAATQDSLEFPLIPSENSSLPEKLTENTTEKLANITENITVDAKNVSENISENVTENESKNVELVTGAVDVTVRIGAFKSRQILQEGEGLQVGNRTFLVVFIGDTPGGPEAFLSVDDESASLGRHDEEYMHDAWLYVHEVYFRDR